MKNVSERKTTRVTTPADRTERVRVVRVNGPAGSTVRWHVSRPQTTKK